MFYNEVYTEYFTVSDEDFRELQLKQVSSRATNWGKDAQKHVEQRIRRSQAPHLEIK